MLNCGELFEVSVDDFMNSRSGLAHPSRKILGLLRPQPHPWGREIYDAAWSGESPKLTAVVVPTQTGNHSARRSGSIERKGVQNGCRNAPFCTLVGFKEIEKTLLE
jgi:hypothetical protein